MAKFRCLGMLLLAVLACVNCTHSKKEQIIYTYIPTHSLPKEPFDQNAQIQIAETAAGTHRALQQLSAIQTAIHPTALLSPPLDPKTIGMNQYTSLDWYGPAEPLLKKIAKISHYQLQVLGKSPAIPAIVNIHKTRILLANILRDVHYQIENKAEIVIFPKRKIIELRYN